LDAELTVPPGAAHKPKPKPGTAYSAEGINTGLPADERFPSHYPMTAHCEGCEEIIRIEWYPALGLAGWWLHTGRRPGE
jgi:hypothetical protein